MKTCEKTKIAVIGLGYVGLPLALEFSDHFAVVGFDISEKRIKELNNNTDITKETSRTEIQGRIKYSNDGENGVFFTNILKSISDCSVFIITVPTPIDHLKNPDLSQLIAASEMVGSVLDKGDVVIYESTTFPGCTEEICVPALEKASGLVYNQDFFVGYSPERINPGDKKNTLPSIIKVTSGSNEETAEFVDNLYARIISAGTYKAPSIKVAEASKAIENAQRDVNISFVNELAIIFEKLGIDTSEVLEAAGTKWNFLKYKPGLVGGHCIDVDPYYLAYKAQQASYQPNVILSGRNVNSNMGKFVASKVIKLMNGKGLIINKTKTLILGFTFKENCPDFRNTKVIDIYNELQEFGSKVNIFDPWVNAQDVADSYNIKVFSNLKEITTKYDAVILAVAHDHFCIFDFLKYKKENGIIYDCKGIVNRNIVNARL